MSHRINTAERARRRRAISDLVHRQVEQVIRHRTTEQTSHLCNTGVHAGCARGDCLCRCHDGEEQPADHRCRVCGMGVVWDVIWGDARGGVWVHVVAPQDHPPQPVKKPAPQG